MFLITITFILGPLVFIGFLIVQITASLANNQSKMRKIIKCYFYYSLIVITLIFALFLVSIVIGVGVSIHWFTVLWQLFNVFLLMQIGTLILMAIKYFNKSSHNDREKMKIKDL